MEKIVTSAYHESTDASSIYRDSASAAFAVQNTAAVAGNLADAMRDNVIVLVHILYSVGVPEPAAPASLVDRTWPGGDPVPAL